jgi:rhodanese-related sulfurtransferase
MAGISRPHFWLVIAIIVVVVAAPPMGYWLLIGRAPGVSYLEARRLVDSGAAVLVDVGLPPPDAAAYAPGAVRWPLASILAARGVQDVPTLLRGRTMLLLCPGGIKAAQASRHLQAIGIGGAYAIRGGLQEWIAAVPAGGSGAVPAFRPAPAYEQQAAVLTFFGVKFFYTLFSAAIVVALWRRREADLATIRWAMIFFFVGEAACFVNVMAFGEHSDALEYLHNAGMVLTFAYTIYGVMEGIDSRLIHYSDAGRCAAAGLCQVCVKHAQSACKLRRVFLMLVPATALLAGVPLLSAYRPNFYNTRIFGVLHSYRHPIIEQMYELRFLPLVAVALLVACLLVLWLAERHPTPMAKILFAAGAGAMGFSFFRLILVACYIDRLVWFDAWEETTELMYTLLVGGVLLIFYRGLLERRHD